MKLPTTSFSRLKTQFALVFLIAVTGLFTSSVFAAGSAKMTLDGSVVGPGYDNTGLVKLVVNGINLLNDGGPSLQKAVFHNSQGETVSTYPPTSSTFDPKTLTLVQKYNWGEISCEYVTTLHKDVGLKVCLHNSSSSTLTAFTLQLASLNFATPPRGWVPGYAYVDSNTGNLPVIPIDEGSYQIAVCNDDVGGKPLLLGFPGRADFSNRPLVISTAPGWVLSPYLDKYIGRPIAPGASDSYDISLRFAKPGLPVSVICQDLISKFTAKYPATLNWPDHRAIGTIVLSQMEDKAHSDTNPYGWFGDPTVDVVSEAGKQAFQARLMAYAANTIKILKDANAQGAIVWDVEGQHYPQPTSYIGDPRLLSVLAPVMNDNADVFFAAFRKAGFRVGLCIRPQQLTKQADGSYAQVDVPLNRDIVALLVDKIKYANKRWGCTLFYCDSNGDPNVPLDPVVFEQATKQIAALGINALIMPEHASARYYACTAPYKELRLNVPMTATSIKQIYPKAFSTIYIPDGPVDQDREQLQQGVAGGDILLFRSWWPDPFNEDVKKIYRAATGQR